MTYDGDSIRIAEIREEARYGGLRVRLVGHLGKARSTLQLDLGYGDAVTPGPGENNDPTPLADLPPPGKAVIAEVYPSIFRHRYAREGPSNDEQDAYATARWMADMAARGALAACFDPPLTPAERAVAALEGWILGVR